MSQKLAANDLEWNKYLFDFDESFISYRFIFNVNKQFLITLN